MVTAFGKSPDGPGTVLRVWEQGGVVGGLAVTLPGNFRTATPVNLRGEKTGEPMAIPNGRLAFPLRAYAPASFVLAWPPCLLTSLIHRFSLARLSVAVFR